MINIERGRENQISTTPMAILVITTREIKYMQTGTLNHIKKVNTIVVKKGYVFL